MRWFYLAVIIVFAAATLLFILQNGDLVTISFLGLSFRAPFAILIAIAYVLELRRVAAFLRCCAIPTKARSAFRRRPNVRFLEAIASREVGVMSALRLHITLCTLLRR